MIFHLTVIIALLFQEMKVAEQYEQTFVMDFTKQEELEKQEKEIEKLKEEIKMKEEILKKLDQKLANTPSSASQMKNLAVNAGKPLKDDRGTNVEDLQKKAQEVQDNLKNGEKSAVKEEATEETVSHPGQSDNDEKKQEYSGPSVLS